jgi:hypothetical protein
MEKIFVLRRKKFGRIDSRIIIAVKCRDKDKGKNRREMEREPKKE